MHRVSAAKSFRWKATAAARNERRGATLRKRPVRVVEFMPGLVTMLLKRARFLVIVRSVAKMERRKFSPPGEIPRRDRETRGNFHGTDISAAALIVNYLHPDDAFGLPILRDTRKILFLFAQFSLVYVFRQVQKLVIR